MKNQLFNGLAFILFALLGFKTASAQDKSRNKDKNRPSIEEIFKKMDANEDEKLSKKEVKGPLKERFKKIDANEDGFITKEEFGKAPKPERKKRIKKQQL